MGSAAQDNIEEEMDRPQKDSDQPKETQAQQCWRVCMGKRYARSTETMAKIIRGVVKEIPPQSPSVFVMTWLTDQSEVMQIYVAEPVPYPIQERF